MICLYPTDGLGHCADPNPRGRVAIASQNLCDDPPDLYARNLLARVAIAHGVSCAGRDIYIAPNGVAHDTSRIGELRNGRLVSSSMLSDTEIAALGLTGKVAPCPCADTNRLYGGVA